MSKQLRRRRSLVFRYLLRPLWRGLKVFLMAFCLGSGIPPQPPRPRTAVEQHETGARLRE